MVEENPDLIEFYGDNCPHCVDMEPLIARLEKEEGLKLTRLEVWNNEANAKKMEGLDKGFCGGVPFFVNKKTNGKLCGAVDYKKFKAWAKGEDE